MWKCRSYVIIMLLALNTGLLFFSLSTFNVFVEQNSNISRFIAKSLPPPAGTSPISQLLHPVTIDDSDSLNEKILYPKESDMMFSVQQQNTTQVLQYTFDQPNESFEFAPDIWADSLGSDTFNPVLYENGLIDTSNNAEDDEGASLFTRIGNNGNDFGINGESTANTSLSDDIGSISAGWKINFPVDAGYDLVNVSFKWRFDTPDGAFDNYETEVLPDGTFTEFGGTPDYQEIRCRITHDETSQAFWLGNPINGTNPNGTVYYRVGPEVAKDEVWHSFTQVFHVESQGTNFTLELGAYLNTREYWNEYFDVWFDELLILGKNNISDNTLPQPIATGLDRTTNISRFMFWANFSEGTWESPIENVTVFYNQTDDQSYFNIMNSTLEFVEPEYITESGYNLTSWQFFAAFNFSDRVSYYFVVEDNANNSYVTMMEEVTIGDYTPPELEGIFINQTGTGLITINVNVSDWGYGVDTVEFNYTVDGVEYDPIDMSGNGTHYQTTILINYSSSLEFGVTLTDKIAGNFDYTSGQKIVPNYPIIAKTDTIDPKILYYNITEDLDTEDRTNITVIATDDFGEIKEVFVEVSYMNGTPHEKYSHVTLENKSIDGVFKLRTMAGESLLTLPYNGSYLITLVAVDESSNEDRIEGLVHEVDDRIAPIVDIPDVEYPAPGSLQITVSASDSGSNINYVWLQKSTKEGWVNYTRMEYNENAGKYYATISTGLLGNELITFRINAVDEAGNDIKDDLLTIQTYSTPIFFATFFGLLVTEIIVVSVIVGIFAAIKIAQRQQLKVVRRKRFDIALGRSERLAYLGEEAIFGFIAAYGQSEGVSSALMWEPRLIGHFYQYLKELIDKANNNVSFIMQTRAQDQVTFVDFYIEEIACSAITFAYPVSTLPQQWLSALTLDQVPIGGSQGILILMLLMREKWSEIAHNFQEEIADGVLELKDMILSGEDKGSIISKAQEFRLFISGTLEVLDEIETETDEISDDIMGDFGTEFLDDSDDDSIQDEPDEEEPSNSFSDNDNDS